MSEYIFILGREPEFSIAELVAVAARAKISLQFSVITNFYAVAQAELSPDFLSELAGLVKVAQVLKPIPAQKDELVNLARETLVTTKNKSWYFGFSWYGQKPNWFKEVGMTLKHEAREENRRARLVVSRDPTLSSVVVAKNKLLPPTGCEFIIVPQDKGRVLVGRTIFVQAFEEWSERDYGRPEREARVGMLPPKLARMMINLAGNSSAGSLLDPFCGSGTVLQEAVLLGYKDLWGFDVDAAGITRTQVNLKWLKEKYPKLEFKLQVARAPIEQLSNQLKDKRLDSIVTEPYLGPPLNGREDEAKLHSIHKELINFYSSTLRILSHFLRPDGRLVMVWPVLQGRGLKLELPLLEVVAKCGFKIEKFLPPQAPSGWVRTRGSLLYERPGQRVAREIFVLSRT
jgi:tRNA G10  N-methylase Trm11